MLQSLRYTSSIGLASCALLPLAVAAGCGDSSGSGGTGGTGGAVGNVTSVTSVTHVTSAQSGNSTTSGFSNSTSVTSNATTAGVTTSASSTTAAATTTAASTSTATSSSTTSSTSSSSQSSSSSGGMQTANLIQDVQDGTIATGATVTVQSVFVTAIHVTAAGNVTVWVQEPQGVTSAAHTYPEYAGVSVFATTAQAATFPAFTGLAVGDCVDLTGTTAEFDQRTEIQTLTAFTTAANCGTAPTAYVIPSPAVSFNSIATDTDLVTTGDQPGTLAETYEGVLVKVTGLTQIAAPDANGDFRVNSGLVSTSNLLIDDFINGSAFTSPAGQTFTSITGVMDQFKVGTIFNYRLVPRGAADLVQ